MKPMVKESGYNDLRNRIRGTFLTQGEIGYDDVRRVHNGMFLRQPAVIVRCLGTADVVEAVGFARSNNLELAVRGGGHSVAGNSVCEGGLMLDLSLMKGIHVDPVRRTARAQGGVTWGEFNRETQLHGLATTGGVVSTTGIAGLTLGGGLGWLLGKHGIAADNLISAEIVTASGEVVTASEEENADLYWGLRGGGGNFGVVTWFEYRLHPIGTVTSGIVVHPIERAGDVLRFFRELTSFASDELTLNGGLLHAPDGSPVSAIAVCHCGSLSEGEAETLRIKQFGTPMMDTIAPTSYEDTNTNMFDPSFPRGARNYWKATFVKDLSDTAVDVIAARFAACPSAMSMLVLEHFHGAATRVRVDDTAFPHREESYNLLIISQWLDSKDDDKNIEWCRATYDAVRPFMAHGSYSNYQTEQDAEGGLERAYGRNHERLVALKNKFDPTNFFHLNTNVRPTT